MLGLDEGARSAPATGPRGASRGDEPAAQAVLQGAARASTPRTRRTGSTLDDLVVLGPIFVLKLKFDADGARAAWSPRCGSTRTTRASSSCRPSACPREAFHVAAEARAYLTERGLDLSGEQQTKTRKALEMLA